MVVVSSAKFEWQWAGRDEYWKIDNYDRCTKAELGQILQERGGYFLRSWTKSTLVKAVTRSTRGLLRYEGYQISELRSFCRQRKLAVPNLWRARKMQLVEALEQADEVMKFQKLFDLPPELRVLIYTTYFDSLPKLEEPIQPPVCKVSRIIRQESLPIFFKTCTFTLSNIFASYATSAYINNRGRKLGKTKGRLFDAIEDGHLQTLRSLAVQYDGNFGYQRLLWSKGQPSVKITTLRGEASDDHSRPSRNLARYLETTRTRPEGNNLLKADIHQLRELMRPD
jgi:hypothetical protein